MCVYKHMLFLILGMARSWYQGILNNREISEYEKLLSILSLLSWTVTMIALSGALPRMIPSW